MKFFAALVTQFFLFLLIVSAVISNAACGSLVLGVTPNDASARQGTASFTFDVVVTPTNNDRFSSFVLAFGVGDGGEALGNGADDADNLAITNFTVGSLFDGTNFSADISGGGIGKSAILVDFTRPAGDTSTILGDGILARFTVDISQAVAGQVFTLDPNIGNFSAAGDAAGDDILIQSSTGSLTITAVPEPTCGSFLLAAGGLLAFSRRRNRTQP